MIYDINYFIEAKNDVDLINIDVNLKNKINNLFSSFDCFDEAKINSKHSLSNKYSSNKYSNNKYSSKHYTNSRYKTNKNRQKNFPNLEKNNIIEKDRTDVEIILSYLNKITHTNYEDLSIRFVIYL